MFISKVNSLVKLIFLISFSASLFINDSLFLFLIPFIILAFNFIYIRVKLNELIGIIKISAVFIVFSFLFMWLSISLKRAVIIVLRLFFSVLASYLFNKTTDMYFLSCSITHVLGRSIAEIIVIALRFIPVIFEQGKRILIIHRYREDKKRIRNYVKLIIPMFLCTLKRSEELSDAMKLRYYDCGYKKTFYKEEKLNLDDYLYLFFSIIYLLFFIFVRYVFVFN